MEQTLSCKTEDCKKLLVMCGPEVLADQPTPLSLVATHMGCDVRAPSMVYSITQKSQNARLK